MKWRWRAWDVAVNIAVLASFVGVWSYVVHRQWISPLFLPGPQASWDALVEGLTQGDLGRIARLTLARVLRGFAQGAVVGVLAGMVIGGLSTIGAVVPRSSRRASDGGLRWPTLRALWLPLLEVCRPFPSAALVPVAIAAVGLAPKMVLDVVTVSTAAAMSIATVRAFRPLRASHVALARALRLSSLSVFLKFALPAAWPAVLADLRPAWRAAVLVALVGEVLSSREGLASTVFQAARSFRSPELFAGVLLIGAGVLLVEAVLWLVAFAFVRWRPVED
jgi:ABC-type nitrate/sulfonate/bicarbonate transport system permease component